MAATTPKPPDPELQRQAGPRVVVAFQESGQARVLSDAAVRLAAMMRAELQGLFVREEVHLDVAHLAVSSFVGALGRVRPVSVRAMEQALERQADACRLTLSRTAEAARIHWTFQTASGELEACVLRQVRKTDLVAIAAPEDAAASALRSEVMKNLAQGAGGVLLAGAPDRYPMRARSLPARSVMAVDDGSAAGEATVRLAATMAASGDCPLVVLAIGDPEAFEEIGARARRVCGDAEVDVHTVPGAFEDDPARVMARLAPSLVVVDASVVDPAEIVRVRRLTGLRQTPFLLVSGGADEN